MTALTNSPERADLRQCGCCGRHLPVGKVAELSSTPGVFICAACALVAAHRAGPLSALARLPIIRSLRRRHRHQPAGDGNARTAIPILPSSNLDRTAVFYTPTGSVEGERYPGYLLLHNDGVELHFSQPGRAVSGECYIHVGDVRPLHERLQQHGIDGLGPLADQDYDLREFALTDPDGNRVRFGSPIG